MNVNCVLYNTLLGLRNEVKYLVSVFYIGQTLKTMPLGAWHLHISESVSMLRKNLEFSVEFS